ncbi:MAG: dUTP diphosphatase [Candidatus Diapherotrites archaeon]
MELKVQRLDKGIELPDYAHEGDAALDLRSAEEFVLKPLEKKLVKTGIKVAIPREHVGLVWDRSGLAAKNGIHVLAGVIDSGYRGEICVVLINLGKAEFIVEKNSRIAQMLIQPVQTVKVIETESLEETRRGEKGFGSTGNH